MKTLLLLLGLAMTVPFASAQNPPGPVVVAAVISENSAAGLPNVPVLPQAENRPPRWYVWLLAFTDDAGVKGFAVTYRYRIAGSSDLYIGTAYVPVDSTGRGGVLVNTGRERIESAGAPAWIEVRELGRSFTPSE
jgi:hypothetical protein